MKFKYIRVAIFILIATALSICLITYAINIEYKQIEYREIPEQIKEETPKIYIEGELTMKDKTEIGKFKVKYKSKNISIDKYATLKIQGSSSVWYPKKNYTIKFFNDEDCTDKFKVDFGWGRENKYVLKANWSDKTHSRNIVTAHLAAQVQDKYNLFQNTPNNGLIDGYPVEVYLNNEFHGLYTLNIPKDDWLYGMDKDNPNHIIMVGEKYSQATVFKELSLDGWNNQLDDNSPAVQQKMLRLINFVMNSTDQEFKEDFEEYLNLDATLNYYVICHTLNIADNTAKNLIFVTYDGKIWYPTLYDLDTTFGSFYNGLELYPTDYPLHMSHNKLFERLSILFKKEIEQRYQELRQTVLSEENIINEIDKFYSQIDPSLFEKEQQKWGELPGYEISQLKEYIHARLPYVDKIMNYKTNKVNA
mgnify:CR=1 FL=1